MTLEAVLAAEIPGGPYKLAMDHLKHRLELGVDKDFEDSYIAAFSQLWEAAQYPDKVWVPRGTLAEHLIGRAEERQRVMDIVGAMGGEIHKHMAGLENQWSQPTLRELRRRLEATRGKDK